MGAHESHPGEVEERLSAMWRAYGHADALTPFQALPWWTATGLLRRFTANGLHASLRLALAVDLLNTTPRPNRLAGQVWAWSVEDAFAITAVTPHAGPRTLGSEGAGYACGAAGEQASHAAAAFAKNEPAAAGWQAMPALVWGPSAPWAPAWMLRALAHELSLPRDEDGLRAWVAAQRARASGGGHE